MWIFRIYILLLNLKLISGQHQYKEKQNDIAQGRYIVEFENVLSVSPFDTSGEDPKLLTQAVFFKSIRAIGINAQPLRNFTSKIFNGASFDIEEDTLSVLEALKSRDNVKNVWPARYLKLFNYNSSPAVAPAWNPHKFTGVQQLHNRGLSGKGVTVAVVDTGIYYDHPALGGGIGEGFKVAGGFNYVGDGYDIDELHPNKFPKDCQGHGTHVAGIVAGSSSSFVGVAPNATLLAYKVFSCAGNPTDDILVAAFERAYFDGADIITCSIGSAGSGFLTDPTSMLASRIAELGVFISIAAGNEGDMGPYYPSSPASGELVTAVASVEAKDIVTWEASANTTKGNTTNFEYVTTTGYSPDLQGDFDLLVYNNCSQILTLPKSSNNNTALLFPLTETCKGFRFYNLAKNLGYPVVFNYLPNNQSQLWYNQPSIGPGFQISVFGTTTFEFGQWALSQIGSGSKIQIYLKSQVSQTRSPYKGAGFLNTFSTWGPTYDGRFYPDVAAPGGNIFSTWLNDRYAILSGTSMATPYIAGVAALYYESIGGRPVTFRAGTDLRKKLITTSNLVSLFTRGVHDSPRDIAPIIQQGGGLINAVALLDTKTVVNTDPAISFVGKNRVRKEVTVVIQNTHDALQTYKVSHQPAITVNTQTKANSSTTFFPPFTHEFLIAKIVSGKVFSIPPNASASVKIKFSLPPGVDYSLGPIFQGKLLFESEAEKVGIPYVGRYFISVQG